MAEQCVLYADDTNIFLTARNETDLYKKANSVLSKLSQWLKHNQLVANVTKSNYIVFSAKNTPLTNNAVVQLDNVTLKNVKHTKFLGVYLDNQLLWHKHVEEIACKIYKKIPISVNYVMSYLLKL